MKERGLVSVVKEAAERLGNGDHFRRQSSQGFAEKLGRIDINRGRLFEYPDVIDVLAELLLRSIDLFRWHED